MNFRPPLTNASRRAPRVLTWAALGLLCGSAAGQTAAGHIDLVAGPRAGTLGLKGPAGARGVLLVGDRRIPLRTDAEGVACVTLSRSELLGNDQVRALFVNAEGQPVGELSLRRLPLGLLRPTSGDLGLLGLRKGRVEVANASAFELPLDDCSLVNRRGQAVRLGGIVLSPGERRSIELPKGVEASTSGWRVLGPSGAVLAVAGPTFTQTPGAAAKRSAGQATGFGQAAVDLPDAGFIDSNFDGIDGDASRAVFVDLVGGSDLGDGSRNAPLASLQLAIDLAASTAGLDHVYVSEGTYPIGPAGALVLQDGISIWGGYSAAKNWKRSLNHVTTVLADHGSVDGTVAIRAYDLSLPTTLGDLRVETAGVVLGQHNQGIKAYAAADLRLERVTVLVSNGSNGLAGAAGGTSSVQLSGGGGGSGGAAPGFAGGKGSSGLICGGQPNSGTGGSGGTTGGNGSAGSNGTVGTHGVNGATGAPTFSISGSNYVQGGTGGSGTDGTCGGGGGGGGGGSGGVFTNGGKGGTGGRGGRLGFGGIGAMPGGASIGLLVSDSKVTVVDGSIATGQGGMGGPGGTGGNFTSGQPGFNGTVVSSAGNGGHGGTGGRGGSGGHGAGGNGGNSFCVLVAPDSTFMNQGAVLTPGSGGAGGPSSGTTGLSGASGGVVQL